MMLVRTEETDLWNTFAATGSSEAREQIVLQAVPLVHYLLNRMGISRETSVDYEDLVHQGLLGLISAVDRYDPSQGTRFSTYAGIRIKGKILDYLRSGDWMSRSARRRVKKIQEAVSAYWGEHQREPTDEELAHTLGMDVKEVQQGLTDSGRILLSLDSAQNDTPDRESLYETEADDNQTDPGELLAEADMKQQMAIAIRKLSEREQLVLSLYYFEELNFKEVGKVLNISESRACQLHARALINLKALINHGE